MNETIEIEILNSIKKEETESDSEYEFQVRILQKSQFLLYFFEFYRELNSCFIFQFIIEDKDYEDIIKRILGEDSDIEDITEVKPQCPECNKTFSRYAYNFLENHLNSIKFFYQNINSDILLSRNSTLKRHLIIHDPNRSKTEQCSICEICGKLIRGVMNTHLRTHSNIKPFSCELCAKAFRTNGALKVHLGLHSGSQFFQDLRICTGSILIFY